ncbi:MAG: hypothetical protein J6S97_09700 [Bacteroidales bacterium]|nr:hypothetical protein [Bacteroidales bacterium]
MYKPPYVIQPSSLDFFGDKLHGTGKWTLHKITRPFDPVLMDAPQEFAQYNFYGYVGKSVRTALEVEREDAQLVKPQAYESVPYVRASFQTPEPTQESVDALLVEEAKKAIRVMLFGSVDKKRQMYIIERRGTRLDAEQKKWIADKEAFEKVEDENENRHNAEEAKKKEKAQEVIDKYDKAHKANELFLYSTQEEVEELFQRLNPHFPADFNAFYQVDLAHKLVNISFEAPSERIIPEEKLVFHSRGSSLKPKTRTEINKDYVDCICSLAYVLAAQCFNLTGKVDNVFISAYSKALNPQTATFEESTLYSIVFDRDTFNWVIRPKSFQPYESLVFFPHTIELGARLNIQPIDPLDLAPAGEVIPGNNQFVDVTKRDERYSHGENKNEKNNDRPDALRTNQNRLREAAELVVTCQKASVPFLQTRLGMGFAKASFIIGQLETMGIIGPQEDNRPRVVLVSSIYDLEKLFES